MSSTSGDIGKRFAGLPRVFLLALAVALLATLALAGAIRNWLEPGGIVGDILTLFAYDSGLRRASLVSAIGLIVTAFVFFSPSVVPNANPKKKTSEPPTRRMVGA
ncbi:MAG: hypothetical protein KatS3mg105_1534 [Gemmatales bacterium]|nr:MAG: hypothetical protein KatS3mg105_1534 [Gemmatales bacterium]